MPRRIRKRHLIGQKPNTNRVSEFEVESKLKEIEKKTEAPIVSAPFFDVSGGMAFDKDIKNIVVDISGTTEVVNTVLEEYPETDWKSFLKRMVHHESLHKEQFEYLKSQGISAEEQAELPYHFLKEFHAINKVPIPIWEKMYRKSIHDATPEEIEEGLKKLSTWINCTILFSREDIREIFGPYDVDEDMIKLKSIGEKITSKEDIVEHFPETKEFLKGWEPWE